MTAFPLTRRTRKTRTKAKSTEHGAKAIIIAGTKSADSSEDVKIGAALNYKNLIFRDEFKDAVGYLAVFSTTSDMALPRLNSTRERGLLYAVSKIMKNCCGYAQIRQ